MDIRVGDILIMKKNHPCGNNLFRIDRVGVDIKITCTKCGRTIMLSRVDFNKRIKIFGYPNGFHL